MMGNGRMIERRVNERRVTPRRARFHVTAAAGVCALGLLLVVGGGIGLVRGAEEEEGQRIEIAGGAWRLTVPAAWKGSEPAVRIIEHEYTVPKAEGDDADGRLTMMAAGGSVEANIERWVGQFKDLPGEGKPQIEKRQVAGLEVQKVTLNGTYLERRGGPFAPATSQPDYALRGAIIPLGDQGNYYLKLTGPAKTLAEADKAFDQVIESLAKP